MVQFESNNPDFGLDAFEALLTAFHASDSTLGDPRNTIKIVNYKGKDWVVKKFRKPNLINQFVYRYIRKSKAERSYAFAKALLEKNILTPIPLCYYENHTLFGLQDSYYVCEFVNAPLTYRDLVRKPELPNHELILRAFTAFTWDMHEKQVLFKDHSPGNTLIIPNGDTWDFYLVDLNRMEFRELFLDDRIVNFSRLSPKKEMVEIMSDEYAKLTREPYDDIFNLMWNATSRFQEKFHRKKRLKKKYKFWKK